MNKMKKLKKHENIYIHIKKKSALRWFLFLLVIYSFLSLIGVATIYFPKDFGWWGSGIVLTFMIQGFAILYIAEQMN